MNQVRNTIRTGRLSPGRSTGRPPVLTFEQEEELVTFVCSSQEARQYHISSLPYTLSPGILDKMPSGMLSSEEVSLATLHEESLRSPMSTRDSD